MLYLEAYAICGAFPYKSMGVKGVYESIHSLKIFDLLACPGLSVNIEEATVTEQGQWREVRDKYSDLSC